MIDFCSGCQNISQLFSNLLLSPQTVLPRTTLTQMIIIYLLMTWLLGSIHLQFYYVLFVLSCLLKISGPIFPKRWWHFPIFHFPQNGHLSWVINKFSNTLKIMPAILTCTNTFILTLLSVVSVHWWVWIVACRSGKLLLQMLKLRSFKFVCLKLLLFVMGKLMLAITAYHTCWKMYI